MLPCRRRHVWSPRGQGTTVMHRGAQQNGRAAHLRRLCRAARAPPHRSPRRSWPRSGARSNAPAAWDGSRSKHRLQEPQKGAGHAARHLHEAEGPVGPAASRCAAPAAPPVARKRLPARPAIKSSDKVPVIIPPPAKSRCSNSVATNRVCSPVAHQRPSRLHVGSPPRPAGVRKGLRVKVLRVARSGSRRRRVSRSGGALRSRSPPSALKHAPGSRRPWCVPGGSA